MSLLELLEKGDVAAFNAQRSPRGRPDLFAAELPAAKLSGVDLSQANLEKADLTGADLSDATLLSADLSGTDGTGIDISGAIAVRIRLRGAWWDEAKLNTADLSRGDLTEVVLTGSSAEGARFVGAKLRHADCKDVVWPDVELSEAKLHHCDLTGADLSRVDLTEAVATEIIAIKARMDGAVANQANFNESDLTGASLVGGRFQSASFAQAKLIDVDLTSADLTRANLSGADLTGANLSGACLADANLEGTIFGDANLEGVDLTGHDPRALGLDEATIDKLAAWGAPVVEDAPLVIAEVSAARNGDQVAMLWLNPDTEQLSTLRWGLVGGGEATHGTLPMSAEGVLARMVVPKEDGFLLLFVQDRPGGAAVVKVPLSSKGVVGASKALPLMYPPAVVPVAEIHGGDLWLTGLARRGPTLVVQKEGEDGFEVKASERVATAKGFWSVHHPVVATRGGVVINVGDDGIGKPVRLPDGFPGKSARVVPFQNTLYAVWFEAAADPDDPGYLKWAPLGGRGEPPVKTLKEVGRVTSLDAVAGPTGVHVAWVERHGLLNTLVFQAKLPSAELGFVEAAGEGGHEVRWAPGPKGADPALVVATLDEQAIAVDGVTRMGVLGA